MPYIRTSTNLSIDPEKLNNIKTKFGEAIKILGKTEDWLMLEFSDNMKMYFRGDNSKGTVFIDVKCLGNISNSNEMTKELTNIVCSELNISADNVYIAYQSYTDWGYNGSNF